MAKCLMGMAKGSLIMRRGQGETSPCGGLGAAHPRFRFYLSLLTIFPNNQPSKFSCLLACFKDFIFLVLNTCFPGPGHRAQSGFQNLVD